MEQEEKSVAENPKKMQSKNNAKMFLFGVGGAIALILIIGYFSAANAVKNASQDAWVLSVAEKFAIPAATVDNQKVLYSSYVEDLTALKKFYKSQPEGFGVASDEQISDQVLARLVANKVLEKVAKSLNVTVTEEEIAAEKQTLLSQFPSEEEAKTNIMDLYGWTLEQFTDKIIRPVVLEQKTAETFDKSGEENNEFVSEEIQARHILFQAEEDEDDESVKDRAEKVLKRIQDGEDFATLAAEFGTDGTKDTGGDLGYFARGAMVPEFENAVFAMKPGDPVGIVKTNFGYHIIEVTDKKEVKDFKKYIDSKLRSADIELKINVHNPFLELQGGENEDGEKE